ncbi:MAG: ATPase domain-containing protein [Thermoplasmata archaeon]
MKKKRKSKAKHRILKKRKSASDKKKNFKVKHRRSGIKSSKHHRHVYKKFKHKKFKHLKTSKTTFKKESKKIVHIKSGIKGFDRLTQGGFVEGSVNAVIGESGSGKTLFAMQFVMEGIRKNEPCLYITFEEKKEEFYKNMLKFGWDLYKAESSGKFIFLEYSPEKIKLMLEEGGGEIENVIISKKIKRLVIDSISSFAMLFNDQVNRRSYILSLFDMLREWGCATIVTSLSNLSDLGDSSAVEFEADSIILLHFPFVKNRRERYIEIRKMRGTKHSTSIYPLRIKKGISVSGRPARIKF